MLIISITALNKLFLEKIGSETRVVAESATYKKTKTVMSFKVSLFVKFIQS